MNGTFAQIKKLQGIQPFEGIWQDRCDLGVCHDKVGQGMESHKEVGRNFVNWTVGTIEFNYVFGYHLLHSIVKFCYVSETIKLVEFWWLPKHQTTARLQIENKGFQLLAAVDNERNHQLEN